MKNQFLIIPVIVIGLMSFARTDKEFKIFQFPQDKIPRIDGDFSDWSMVPESYTIGLDELRNTKFGEGKSLDPEDFDIKVKVGWVKDLNRLYFFIDAYDDFWDFNDPALKQDIFELVIDGDISGGSFINEENGNTSKEQNPVHQYNSSGLWTVVLTVEGAAGKSVRSKVWDVVTQ